MIVGHVGRTSGRPYVEGSLFLPSQSITGNVSFLVDTGADITTLMPADGLTLGIDYGKLTAKSPTSGFGGSIDTFRELGVLAFHEQDRRKLRFYAVTLVLPGPNTLTGAMPSVLGRDILGHWRLTYDQSRKTVTCTVRSADHTAWHRPLG